MFHIDLTAPTIKIAYGYENTQAVIELPRTCVRGPYKEDTKNGQNACCSERASSSGSPTSIPCDTGAQDKGQRKHHILCKSRLILSRDNPLP